MRMMTWLDIVGVWRYVQKGKGGEVLVEILGSLRANKNRLLCRSCVVKDL